MVVLDQNDSLPEVDFPKPEAVALAELAQVAARRFDRLPNGVGGIVPQHRPDGLTFNRYAQSVIDAPLIAAEFCNWPAVSLPRSSNCLPSSICDWLTQATSTPLCQRQSRSCLGRPINEPVTAWGDHRSAGQPCCVVRCCAQPAQHVFTQCRAFAPPRRCAGTTGSALDCRSCI